MSNQDEIEQSLDLSSEDGSAIFYKDYNRGRQRGEMHHPTKAYDLPTTSTGNACIKTVPCSPEYLEKLLKGLRDVRNSLTIDRDQISGARAKQLLSIILQECNRLEDEPELFTIIAERDHFFETVHRHVAQIIAVLEGWQEYDELQLDVLAEMRREQQNVTRPTYQPGLKPWSQFLSNGAPGAPSLGQAPAALLAVQIVPYGGSKILETWTKKHKELMSAVMTVSLSTKLLCLIQNIS